MLTAEADDGLELEEEGVREGGGEGGRLDVDDDDDGGETQDERNAYRMAIRPAAAAAEVLL